MPAIRPWSEWGTDPPTYMKVTDAAFRTFVMLGRDPRWTLVVYENPARDEIEYRLKGPHSDHHMIAISFREAQDEVATLATVVTWIDRTVPPAPPVPAPPVVVAPPRPRTQVFPVKHPVGPKPVEPQQGVRKIDLLD